MNCFEFSYFLVNYFLSTMCVVNYSYFAGLFSWFTVNYYIGALENPSKSYPVMDLGGGSTQITFIPSSKVGLFLAVPLKV